MIGNLDSCEHVVLQDFLRHLELEGRNLLNLVKRDDSSTSESSMFSHGSDPVSRDTRLIIAQLKVCNVWYALMTDSLGYVVDDHACALIAMLTSYK